MRTNFTQCRLVYENPSADYIRQYGWTGDVVQIPKNATTQISTYGCRSLCGTGNDWYKWEQQASTMTTWVLPVVGILLQAPFTSNAFWETIFSLARWVGSPMASLSYILWNIKVSGKCALLVDLATPYGTHVTDKDTDFSKIRDSFYLLMTMNQYTMKEHVRQKKEAEGLLRIALFSKDLRLLKVGQAPEGEVPRASFEGTGPPGGQWAPVFTVNGQNTPDPPRPDADMESAEYLTLLRQQLADDLRAKRRRGVVPVFISTMWFVFSLGLSIQGAFGFLGENAQAHDLALGLLLAWLPVLILSSIVDRNPVAADDIRMRLNELVDRVRQSLMDDTVKRDYLETIADRTQQTEMNGWVEKISKACPELENFFVKFAGQGRKRFHYGAAHPILTDIERAYIADRGRDWLHFEAEARNKLVLGDVSGGLDWLDPRELWQVLSAVVVVGGTTLGAFILSYFTPTVGLGCRSGGYTIFGTVAFGLLLVEMVCWWVFDASKPRLSEMRRNTLRHPQMVQFLVWYAQRRNHFDERSSKAVLACRNFLQNQLSKLTSPSFATAADQQVKAWWMGWQEKSAAQRVDRIFFKPIECFNCIWLCYITLAQTTGAYNNCKCKSSTWGGGGGYIDWNVYNTATSPYVRTNWTIATVLSSTIMAAAMSYIVTEWCLQSHLSTADVRDAARGLYLTRHFRWLTSPFRDSMHYAIEAGYFARRLLSQSIQGRTAKATAPTAALGQNRRSVRWTKRTTPFVPELLPGGATPLADLQHSRPRSSSDAPLIGGRSSSGSPPGARASHDEQASEVGSPSSLRVPDGRPGFVRGVSEGSLSV
ncbi:hypothetical protein WHR41_05232 [Cladosporium halotolerans]|uniref:Uncharacterized protein n=1 Tax=Cladosporium halotolerans TaxID=1052096 RepID=A0AB34KSW8_9PEZI